MPPQTYKTPNGAERISLPCAEYQDLIDARDHAIAMRNIAGGAPVLTESELDAFLAAASPQKAGITQPFLAQIETGAREGSVTVLNRIAQAPGTRIEDLING